MKKWLILAILILLGALVASMINLRETDKKYKDAAANMKAYDLELSNEKDKSIALKLTVNQLEYFKDSVIQELDATRKELKIKDKNLKSLQSVTSVFTKTDTIVFTDTIISHPSVFIDTLLKDEWYSVRVGLKYPSTLAVSPNFVSKKHIVVSTKKETVNPPKKFFLFRWFQKKHTVLQVNVVEKNPYITEEESKYIEVID